MIRYDRIKAECDRLGITGYKLCKDCNISKSIITDIKMGRKSSLSAENASKIANRLGVSVDYLIGEESSEDVVRDNSALSDSEQFILRTYRMATKDGKRMMLIFAKGLSINLEREA